MIEYDEDYQKFDKHFRAWSIDEMIEMLLDKGDINIFLLEAIGEYACIRFEKKVWKKALKTGGADNVLYFFAKGF
jgi:hypothetical protein